MFSQFQHAQPTEKRGMILLPFEPPNLSQQRLQSALDRARESKSWLVLLCVRPASASLWHSDEDETLFSGLKALQAQLQSQSVPVTIETVTGSAAQLVLDFASNQNVDMIVIPGRPVNGTRSPIA